MTEAGNFNISLPQDSIMSHDSTLKSPVNESMICSTRVKSVSGSNDLLTSFIEGSVGLAELT